MPKEKLTKKQIDGFKDRGRYGDGGNLYLNVSATGSKSWAFLFTRDGKSAERGLGPYPDVSIDEAREKAGEYRRMLRQGVEPPKTRGTSKKPFGSTFKDIAERYIAAHRESWRNDKSEAQWRSSLTDYAYPIVGNMDVSKITIGHIHEVLEPIWTTKAETARRVRWRIGKVLGFAAGLDLRDDVDLTRRGGKLDYLLPKASKVSKGEGHAALPYVEMPSFMAELRGRKGIAPRALEFLILTAARTNEVITATWDEIDLKAGVWTIPANRMKAGREHRVPLTETAVALLKNLPRDRDQKYVFIGQTNGGEPLSNMAMTVLLKRMGRKEGVTVHGFRSTFRTWSAEQNLDIPREIAEAALAHAVGGVEGAYQRGDYFHTRRKLMERWTAFCAGGAGDNVVPIKAQVQ
jgi:integrase